MQWRRAREGGTVGLQPQLQIEISKHRVFFKHDVIINGCYVIYASDTIQPLKSPDEYYYIGILKNRITKLRSLRIKKKKRICVVT